VGSLREGVTTFEQLEERGMWEPNSGCLIWMGSRNKAGYGHMGVPGTKRTIDVHRFSWSLFHGLPIPADREILHQCDNPPCFGPNHLRPGTQSENIYDAAAKGRLTQSALGAAAMAAKAAARTHCHSGHAYSDDNLYIEPVSRRRRCRACDRSRQRIKNGTPEHRYRGRYQKKQDGVR
jgi:HNH endonuclease